MTDLRRYARQMVLPEVGEAGQALLADSRVLVFGAGGLGCAALPYLAGAGVGELTIVDPDAVDISNLQRQHLHSQADIGRAKAESARERLLALNPDVSVHAVTALLGAESLHETVAGADVVLDCTDNFPARFAINDACRAARVPLVLGAAIRGEGQCVAFRFDTRAQPDYRSLFGEDGAAAERCEDAGILGPVVGIIGAAQALIALKLLLGIGRVDSGTLNVLDALDGSLRQLRWPAD